MMRGQLKYNAPVNLKGSAGAGFRKINGVSKSIPETFFSPWVAVIMVSVLLPEAGFVCSCKLKPEKPFR
jgi:hypothetical protein